MLEIDKNTFDPALLSFADCDFLLAHAGEAPVVAIRELTSAQNRATVRQWIERFYELDELKKARGLDWAGVEAVKTAIKTYLRVREEWKKDESYGAPRNPSMFAYDARGNAHEGATGSDSGRVRTYFDETGKRIPFAINLIESGATGQWKPKWATKAAEQNKDFKILEPEGKNCLECGVPACGHTETFKPESRSSKNAARARMSKHCRTTKSEIQSHLELHTLEFGSSSQKSVR